eukprot:11181452-Lingulodinium_polyedra.AAC.1
MASLALAEGCGAALAWGGTASTILWNIGYDPIVRAIQGPTYVDDLSRRRAAFLSPSRRPCGW